MVALEAAKKEMLARYPFFGSLAASVECVKSTNLRTMGSNGRTIFYNPDYIESLSEEDRVFVLTHEICHIAFDHINRGRGKDPVVWQEATDAVINQLLKRDGMKIIKGGVDYPEAIDYDADSYYEFLMEHKLEIELQEEGEEIRFPKELVIRKEVTGDPAYKNSTLAEASFNTHES